MIDYGIAKASGIGLLSALLYTQIAQLKRILEQSQQVKKAPVQRIQQIEDVISKRQNSNLHLLKLTPYYLQEREKQKSVHTVQKIKYEPSDRKLAESLKTQLSTRINFKNQVLNQVQWFAQVQHPHLPNSKRYQKICGFGKIQGDFFNIKRKYQPVKKLNIWERVRNWTYQQLYSQSYVIQQPKHYGFFVGPVVGYLKYQIDLMKDLKILALCNIQDGNIIPQVTATSKSQILNYYKNLIGEKYIKIGALIVGTIVLGRMLWSDIKTGLNAMKIRNNEKNNKYFKMQVPTDDKMCIICYSNSRNMIFFDCRHMIMCHDCSENYDSDVCPYCKMEIDDIKPVVGIK